MADELKRDPYADTDAEVIQKFLSVCREMKPVGQWPGEHVCAAIGRLVKNQRRPEFIPEADRAPLREHNGRGGDEDRAFSGPRNTRHQPNGGAGSFPEGAGDLLFMIDTFCLTGGPFDEQWSTQVKATLEDVRGFLHGHGYSANLIPLESAGAEDARDAALVEMMRDALAKLVCEPGKPEYREQARSALAAAMSDQNKGKV